MMINEPYYSTKNNDFTLHQGDSYEVLHNIKESFDMIFADPPYFISGGGKTIRGNRVIVTNFGEWDKIRPDNEKDELNCKWLSLCREKLKDNGTIWVSGTFHNIWVGSINSPKKYHSEKFCFFFSVLLVSLTLLALGIANKFSLFSLLKISL